MKRKIIALTLIVSAILTFSACGGGGDIEICFHDWQKEETEENLYQAATCQSPAIYFSVCSECGAKGSSYESGEKGEHSYKDEAVDGALFSAATCTAAAVYYKSCEYCGKLGEETFSHGSARAHTYVEIASVDTLAAKANCSSPSIYKLSCSECGKMGSTTFTLGPKMPHSDTEGDFMCDHCMRPLKVFDDVPVDNLAGRHEFGQ
ncbi:MAG: hypothetical protein IJW48_03490 [Clostridia bacterium]|nr:hypothetical protein [Clostridia bacterium]